MNLVNLVICLEVTENDSVYFKQKQNSLEGDVALTKLTGRMKNQGREVQAQASLLGLFNWTCSVIFPPEAQNALTPVVSMVFEALWRFRALGERG